MKSNHYIRLIIKNVPAVREDELVELVFQFGAEGTSEVLQFSQPILEYDPETLGKEFLDLEVYFSTAPSQDLISNLKINFPEVTLESHEEATKDWLEEWKKGFHSFELTDGVWIVPSWEKPPKEAKKVLKMEPGLAFGTGTHETTQLASDLIVEVLKSHLGASVLDVGTGTGILGILAEMYSAKRVIGIDKDIEALRVARENAELNQTKYFETDPKSVEENTEVFDLVIANIIDGILLNMQTSLVRAMGSKGHLVLSGILQENEKNLVHEFKLPKGFHWKARKQKGEWVALLAGPISS